MSTQNTEYNNHNLHVFFHRNNCKPTSTPVYGMLTIHVNFVVNFKKGGERGKLQQNSFKIPYFHLSDYLDFDMFIFFHYTYIHKFFSILLQIDICLVFFVTFTIKLCTFSPYHQEFFLKKTTTTNNPSEWLHSILSGDCTVIYVALPCC